MNTKSLNNFRKQMSSVANEKCNGKDSPQENQEGEWSKEQEGMLKNLVNIYGQKEWEQIAINLNSTFIDKPKTDVQCQKRWESSVPQVYGSKEPWSDKEELELLLAHQKHKNKWSNISEELKFRDNNTIKNRFYSIFRKVKSKVQKNDLTYASELEALETVYMLSIAVQYLSNPATATKLKGKRGKDFLCSLVHNLNIKIVQEYKDKFDQLTRQLGSIETQFNNLAVQMNLPKMEVVSGNIEEQIHLISEPSQPESRLVPQKKNQEPVSKPSHPEESKKKSDALRAITTEINKRLFQNNNFLISLHIL